MDELNSLVKRHDHEFNQLKVERFELEKVISKIYHTVEHNNFSDSEGIYLIRQLQDVLRHRRVIKNQLDGLSKVRNNLKMHDFKNHIDAANVSMERADMHEAIDDWQEGWKDYMPKIYESVKIKNKIDVKPQQTQIAEVIYNNDLTVINNN